MTKRHGNRKFKEDQERAKYLEKEEFQKMVNQEQFILSISDDGRGQLSSAYEYRPAKRGGKGVLTWILVKDLRPELLLHFP